jgi:hypothetical protein
MQPLEHSATADRLRRDASKRAAYRKRIILRDLGESNPQLCLTTTFVASLGPITPISETSYRPFSTVSTEIADIHEQEPAYFRNFDARI